MKKSLLAKLLAMVLALTVFLCGCTVKVSTKPEDAEEETTEETAEVQTDDAEVEETEAPADEGDLINMDKLKEIEAADTFGVKITDKALKTDYYSDISTNGQDAITFKITNDTGVDISKVTIMIVGYDDSNHLQKLRLDLFTSLNGDKYVSLLTSEDSPIAAGATEEFALRLHADEIAGARMIVYSYTDANGNEVKNDAAETWYDNLRVGGTTALD